MKKNYAVAAAGVLSLCSLAAAPGAFAGPADHVFSPIVEYGEREIELKGGRAKFGDGTREQAAILGLGLGVKPWWFTEIEAKFEGASGASTKYEATEWENIFQLTETGKYPFDAGFLVEIERPRSHAEGWEVTYGPLLQTDVGRVELNGNVLFESHAEPEEARETVLQYQWQAKYRWRPQFEYGVQGFGELGKWNDWAPSNAQSHELGPAVFGKIGLGGRRALRYDAAYLIGVSSAAPDRTLRFRVEYEF